MVPETDKMNVIVRLARYYPLAWVSGFNAEDFAMHEDVAGGNINCCVLLVSVGSENKTHVRL